jgi:hypothetical protein
MKQLKNKTFADILAFLISTVFSPYITAVVFIIAIIYNSSHDINEFLPWMITFLFFGLIIPFIYVLWQIETGTISDFRLSIREERKIPFIITGISAIIGTLLLFYLGAAWPVVVMAITFSVNAIAVAIITQYWKISIHMAVFASVSTVVSVLYGPKFIWLYIVLIPLAWSRIHRKRHNLMQVSAGALLSFILTAAVFWACGYI